MGQRKCSFAVLFGVLCSGKMKLVLSENLFSNQNISKMFVFRFLMFLFCPLLKMADAIVLFRSVFRVFLFEGVTPRSYRRRVDVPGSNAHWMRVYRPEATHWLSGCNVKCQASAAEPPSTDYGFFL